MESEVARGLTFQLRMRVIVIIMVMLFPKLHDSDRFGPGE